MQQAGWSILHSSGDFASLARSYALYEEVRHLPAWHDYLARMRSLHDTYVNELLTGTLDKYGISRDDEKRAVLHVLRTMLTYPDVVRDTFEKRRVEVERAEALHAARQRGPLHGVDM